MKPADLHNRTKDDLNHLLTEMKTKLLKLNFDMADNKVKDTSQLKKLKKDIARVLTELKSTKK